MTPRERVLAALNHEQPDRVPIDLSGHRSSGIAAIAYRKLRAAMGLPERTIRATRARPEVMTVRSIWPR